MNLTEAYYTISSFPGSFWRRNLTDSGKRTAEKLTRIPWQSRVASQLQESADWLLSTPRVWEYDVSITFKDSDVIWLKEAIQQRVGGSRPAESILPNNAVLSEDSISFLSERGIIVFPTDGEIRVDNATYDPRYVLRVSDDLQIAAIRLNDGTVLSQGIDFESDFGYIILEEHPFILCEGSKMYIAAAERRKRNLLDFSLAVDEVHGPVDRILYFYRTSQTPYMLMYAAAQSAGIAVAEKDFTVFSVSKGLGGGFIYYSVDGYYLEAFYPHTQVSVGTLVRKNTIIGNVLSLVPASPVDASVQTLPLDAALPIKGLIATRTLVKAYNNGIFSPALEGDPESLQAYWQFLAAMETGLKRKANLKGGAAVLELGSNILTTHKAALRVSGVNSPGVYWDSDDVNDAYINPMEFYFNFLLSGKLVIIRLDADLPISMKARVRAFLERETLAGSVMIILET